MGEIIHQLPLALISEDPLQQRLAQSLKDISWGHDEIIDLGEVCDRKGYPIIPALWSKELVNFVRTLIKPQTFQDFEFQRNAYLAKQIKRWERWELNRDSKGEQFDSVYDETLLWTWVLQTAGIVVAKDDEEYHHYYEQIGHSLRSIRSDTRKILTFLSAIPPSLLRPDEKVIDFISAPSKIADLKRDGLRVGVAFGIWDLNHPGHWEFLESARTVLGKHGRLLVAVSSDEETKLFKGSERPIYNFEQRVSGVSRLSCVDYVIPVPSPSSTPTEAEVEAYYFSILKNFAPHFRLIGQVDSNFELFCGQCEAAGIGILHSGEERKTSTTAIIEEIVKRYSGGENLESTTLPQSMG